MTLSTEILTRSPLLSADELEGEIGNIISRTRRGPVLARATTRSREMAIRLSMGAGRGRLIRQLLTESLLLAAGGAFGGLLLALAVVRALASIAPVALPRLEPVAIDGRVLTFSAPLSALECS